MQKMVVSMTEPMLSDAVSALYTETDTEFARDAMPGNIKFLEGFWRSDTSNEKLLLLLVQGYSAYALGYLEDEEPARARAFYQRSLNLAIRLFPDYPVIQNGGNVKLDDFTVTLAQMEKGDVERLFWLGMSWGSYINFSKSDPEALSNISYVLAIMDRVLELDETYYFGGAHLFKGTFYASLPVMFGGSPEKSKIHFDKTLAISKEKFLFAKFYYAKFYAYQIQDKELFIRVLKEVISADVHILPGMELPNALAKERAKVLLKDADILF